MHLIMSFLEFPMYLFSLVGNWLSNVVFTPFALGTTAKQVMEEQLGVYGVLAYLVYKLVRLGVDAFPLFRPDWLRGDLRRVVALIGLVLVSSYVVTSAYIGLIAPELELTVSIGGLITASLIAWIALAYHYIREKVDEAREAKEAAEENA